MKSLIELYKTILFETPWFDGVCPWTYTIDGKHIDVHKITYDEKFEKFKKIYPSNKFIKKFRSRIHKFACPICGYPIFYNMNIDKIHKAPNYKNIFLPKSHPYYNKLKSKPGIIVE